MKKTYQTNKIEDNRKEIWDLSQNLQNLKEIETFPNNNLLINGNFRINQRGLSSYSSTSSSLTYTVDRWCFPKFANMTCTPLENGGVTITAGNISGHSIFAQIVDKGNYYSNKTLTFSVKYANLVGSMAIKIYDGNSSRFSQYTTKESGKLVLTLPMGEISELSCEIVKDLTTTSESFSVDILEAKLEVGKQATEFHPRLFDEELSLCKRYYRKIDGYWGRIIRYDASTISFILPFAMRRIPDLKLTSYYIQSYTCNSSTYAHFTSGFTVSVNFMSDVCIRLFFNKSNHAVNEGIIYLNGKLDAEIY